MKDQRSVAIKIVISAILAVVLGFIIRLYLYYLPLAADGTGFSQGWKSILMQILQGDAIYILIAISFIMISACSFWGREIGDFLYRFRFLIALIVFTLCVFFQIHGSSLGIWGGVMGTGDAPNLLGVSRHIRSDEWAVQTPMMLSQYYNANGAFPYWGETVRGTITDMFIVYGQPVRHIAVLFRPFHWGYLFLPPGHGLSFYWMGRLIALFLVSFEMMMLITKSNKKLSLAGAFLVAFGPGIQWWFAINGFAEMLIFGQLAIILFRQFLLSKKLLRRALCTIAIGISAGGFIFTIYPPWQVPMAYIIIGLALWTIIDVRGKIKPFAWKDGLVVSSITIVIFALIVYILFKSRDTIEVVLNTDFPGRRVETGGIDWRYFMNGPTNLWYALLNTGSFVNVVESARFIDFFPLSYLIPVIALIKNKGRDALTIILLALSVFLSAYIFIGFPEAIASITFLGLSLPIRAMVILGFLNILLLFRGLANFQLKITRGRTFFVGAISIVLGIMVVALSVYVAPEFFSSKVFEVATIVLFSFTFFTMFLVFQKHMQRLFLLLCMFIALFSGALVNPIHRGVNAIYDLEVMHTIQAVREEQPEALWVFDNVEFFRFNFGMMAGAATINTTNTYPALERWEQFDPEGAYRYIYNRYAHILMNLEKQDELTFDLVGADVFRVSLAPQHLHELGVTYVFTNRDLRELFPKDFTLKKTSGNYFVFKLK